MNKLEFQNEIVNRIDASCENHKIFHSYIFSGNKNSGQIEVANYFASKLIECYVGGSHPNLFYITTEKQNISTHF